MGEKKYFEAQKNNTEKILKPIRHNADCGLTV